PHPERTIFTRFIPARKPGRGVGMWRHYYDRWGSMTIDQIGPEMIGLVPDLARFVPPARTFDKNVYSPWTGSDLHKQLRSAGIDALIMRGNGCVRARNRTWRYRLGFPRYSGDGCALQLGGRDARL